MKTKFNQINMLICIWVFAVFNTNVQAAEVWSLQMVIEKAFANSNSLRAAKASVKIQQGNLEQIKKWPNPSVEIEGNNKLGKQDGKDDYSLTTFSLSQPLPIFRLPSEKAQASEFLLAEDSNLRFQALKMEYDLAQGYHELQFKKEVANIAQEKLSLVEQKLDARKEDGGIVRFLSPLEKSRLNIIKQNAVFELEKAKGEYEEAMAHIKVILGIDESQAFEVSSLTADLEIEGLEELKARQEEHPLILSIKHNLQASQAAVRSAKMSRFEDPEIKIFSEKDLFDERRESFYGGALSVKLPFWDRKEGLIKKEMADAERVSFELKARQIELQGDLNRSYQHFQRLKRLEKEYSVGLKEAKNFLNLTVKGFSAGDSNILTLIDAYNTYYDSQLNYLEILRDLWLEYSKIHLASNIAIIKE